MGDSEADAGRYGPLDADERRMAARPAAGAGLVMAALAAGCLFGRPMTSRVGMAPRTSREAHDLPVCSTEKPGGKRARRRRRAKGGAA